MASFTEQIRAWSGPAILSYGFRPFFLCGSLWAAVSMVLWVMMYAGLVDLPTALDPVSWHAHEALFGYLGAILAGFLLTAVPNWTGRAPLAGLPLLGLLGVWIIGRVAMAVSLHLPPGVVVIADVACLVVLAAFIFSEIVNGKNWRNLIVVAMLVAFIAGNVLFHWEAAEGGYAAEGYGLRLGLAAAVMMIALIGGRIVPSFTRNWLVKRGSEVLPADFGRFDKATLVTSLIALLCWVIAPDAAITGLALLGAGLIQAVRLIRWAGMRTGGEALVWILHVGYAFVPLGMLAIGTAILFPGALSDVAAQHLWMAGAIGVMTLAIMTRATLGHTGQALTAGMGTVVLYGLLIGSVLTRLGGGMAPTAALELYALSGALWCAAFAGFAVLYGPLIVRPRG